MTAPSESFQKIDLLRAKLGVPVTVMAKACGVSRIAYYGWVKGGSIRTTNLRRLHKVAAALVRLARLKELPEDPLLTDRGSGTRMLELIQTNM